MSLRKMKAKDSGETGHFMLWQIRQDVSVSQTSVLSKSKTQCWQKKTFQAPLWQVEVEADQGFEE